LHYPVDHCVLEKNIFGLVMRYLLNYKKLYYKLNVYALPVKLRASLLISIFIVTIPVLFAYLVLNIYLGSYVFLIQNSIVAFGIVVSFLFLLKGRYEAAVNVTFVVTLSIAQLSFLISDMLNISAQGNANLILSMIHACVVIMLLGIFAVRSYQFIASASITTTIFLMHISQYKDVIFLNLSSYVGLISYYVLSLSFAVFNVYLFRKLTVIINEKEKLNKDLEEASRVKSQFLANVSHEIRNPLNAIIGMTELLKDDSHNENKIEYVKNIELSAGLLSHMVKNILSLNKIENNTIEYHEAEFNLCDTVLHVLELYTLSAQKKGLDVNLDDMKKCNYLIKSDPFLLSQILINILDNAVKFTDKGRISAYNNYIFDDNVLKYSIVIEDTGIGMNAETLSKIFEAFYQGDGSYSKQHGGAGIGLSIVKHMVGLLDGDIDISSKENKGTSVSLNFSFNCTSRISDDGIDEDSQLKVNSIENFSKKIFIAEDNAVNNLYLVRILEKSGFQVESVFNGSDLISLIENEIPDLVIMDLQMPGKSGFDCVRYISNHENNKISSLPFIVITGYSFETEREKMVKSGIGNVLIKPIKENELIQLIHSMF